MGNWWIDESAPTPGPDNTELTWAELIDYFRSFWTRTSRATTIVWHGYSAGFIAALDEATRVSKSFTEAVSGVPAPPDRSDKRAYALWAKQNRSVGPRSGWHFERDGRKVT
jgi:hypothetical protein